MKGQQSLLFIDVKGSRISEKEGIGIGLVRASCGTEKDRHMLEVR